jgi:peptide subunit release factor 1 (eRF1)
MVERISKKEYEEFLNFKKSKEKPAENQENSPQNPQNNVTTQKSEELNIIGVDTMVERKEEKQDSGVEYECPNCHAVYENRVKFCSTCGTEFQDEE